MNNNYIITATNYNPLYYEFLPSVYYMWKKYCPNCKFILGFVDDRKDKNNNFIEKIKKYCDELHIINTIKGVESSILGKITRMWLCSLYEDNICTNVDIDQYLLNFDWFKNKIKEATNDKFVCIGHNMYLNTEHDGKWSMSFTTAKSNIWKKIINPNSLKFQDWINKNKIISNPIDNKESLSLSFTKFSDESLLRYFVVKHPDSNFISNVLHKENREDGYLLKCKKRVDRGWWHKFNINLLHNNYYIDSQPLRPFNKNYLHLKPLLMFIGIDNKQLFL
jgi:hypothetical protein